MRTVRRNGWITVCGGLLAAAVVTSTPTLADAKTTSGSTATALRKAGWASNVTASFPGSTFRFRSDGVPKRGVLAEYAVPNPGIIVPNASNSHVAPSSEVVKKQHYDIKITTTPKKAKKPTTISAGPIGVMISGALVFNPYEGDGTTVAMASNFTLKDAQGRDVPFLDACNGHPSPGAVFAYHYHGLPPCVTATVDKKNGPSHIIGVAFDGFPIYGDRDVHGKRITAKRLDRCNGITSPTPEFPHGIYHYVLLNVASAKSSPACFAGVLPSTPTKVFRNVSSRGAGASFSCWLPTESGRPAAGLRAIQVR
jgi:hypothetical protein